MSPGWMTNVCSRLCCMVNSSGYWEWTQKDWRNLCICHIDNCQWSDWAVYSKTECRAKLIEKQERRKYHVNHVTKTPNLYQTFHCRQDLLVLHWTGQSSTFLQQMWIPPPLPRSSYAKIYFDDFISFIRVIQNAFLIVVFFFLVVGTVTLC